MIFIISDGIDNSTNIVINWLKYYNIKYCVLNSKTKIKIKYISLNEFVIELNNIKIESNEIIGYWFRNEVSIISNNSEKLKIHDKNLVSYIKQHELAELDTMLSYIFYVIESKKTIGCYYKRSINKLLALKEAKSIGIDIPEFLIASDSENIISHFGNSIPLLTKTIGGAFNFNNEDIKLKSYSEIFDPYSLISSEFSPSLIQKYIEKNYEIRTFFFKGSFHSMAIFSQKNEHTIVDMKKSIPIRNRSVPYKLPKLIEEKLLEFMKKLDLDTASIDIIKGKDGKFYFLEVNQFGIFSNVSNLCNYYLEKKITDYLITD